MLPAALRSLVAEIDASPAWHLHRKQDHLVKYRLLII